MQEIRNLQQHFSTLDLFLGTASWSKGDASAWFGSQARSGGGFDVPFPDIVPSLSLEIPAAGDIPGNDTTTTSITLGGSVQSAIETSGDHDWIRVELVAGQNYQFALSGTGGGALSDPFLHLRDSNGSAVASNDDGGPGLNSLINFAATTSGTYYLDAHAYSNETGDYTLTATQTAPPAPEIITDSIDWGTQVSGTAFTVYFATTGQRFDGETAAENWSAAEKAAAMAAFGVYSDVANITFTETSSKATATFVLVKATMAPDTLGYFNPPGETNAGVGVFNHTSSTWTNQGLLPGGYAFVTLIHEFGHGLGLAHPHDDGGTSSVMSGVTSAFGSYGTAGLNQGVFTTMSYNDGWATGPNGTGSANGYGWQGTLGPLDIALIQAKYGSSTSFNNGNSNYQIANSNTSGTMYQAIWDTGGTDAIVYSGARDAVIDLRAATILDAVGGGGYVSYVTGIIGGYTIANGVVIENASGGSGDDTITGNSAANILTGNGGNDAINGGGGDDIAVFSGNQADYTITDNSGGSWTVRDLRGGTPDGTDTLTGIETLRFADGDYGDTPPPTGNVITGDDEDNVIDGTAGDDTINAGGGADRVTGRAGNDVINGEDGNDRLFGHGGDDTITGGYGRDVVRGGDGADNIHGGGGHDNLRGDAGDDEIRGGGGNDYIRGGDGDDFALGNNGNDRFMGGAGNDRFNGGDGAFDKAIFSGNLADYQLDYLSANGEVRVTDLRGGSPDGMDRLFHVELLEFANGQVEINGGSFDFTANASPIVLPVSRDADAPAAKIDGAVMDTSADAVPGVAHLVPLTASGGDNLSGIGRVSANLPDLQGGPALADLTGFAADMAAEGDAGPLDIALSSSLLIEQHGWVALGALNLVSQSAAAATPVAEVLPADQSGKMLVIDLLAALDPVDQAAMGAGLDDASGWM